jgi:hypothetical protein
MSKLRYLLPLAFLFAAFVVMPAGAQDNNAESETISVNLEGANGALDLKHTLETYANVNMTVGDQIYRLRVPVTVQIDASTLLADSLVSAPAQQQVGVILLEPLRVETIQGEYQKQYRTVSPASPENVIVVFTAKVTNLHNEPLEARYSSTLRTFALDDTGNTYEEEERFCDSIGPGVTIECEFIFDAPASANLVDLKVETVAFKRFSFPTLATRE